MLHRIRDYIEADIRRRFFAEYPGLVPHQNKFDVFQAIRPDVLRIYPNLFTPNEINTDIRNLRAACWIDCPGMPDKVKIAWQGFLSQHVGQPITRQDVIDFARKKVDRANEKCLYPLRNQHLNPFPVVTYRLATFPNIGKHIATVQLQQPQWKILHHRGPNWRELSPPPRAINKIPLSTDKTKSRDEYPFASAYEDVGAAHLEYVPIVEQRLQAILMSRFYDDERLQAGDAFRVEVVP